MEAAVISNALQWGALGVLMMVLVGVALYLREQAKATAAREAANQAFMQRLVTESTELQRHHEEAYRHQLQMTTEVLQGIRKDFELHCNTTTEAHRVIMDRLSRLRRRESDVG